MRLIGRKGKLLTLGAALAALTMAASACGGGDVQTGPGEDDAAGKEITIGLIPWEEGIAVTALWQVVLEEKGYKVNVENVDVAPVYQGLAQGDIDVYLDTWLPDTHKDYWAKYGDELEDIGVWYDKATLELTVPSYVKDVNTIADLKDKADEFGNEIVGIESGSGLVRTTKEEAIPDYGLDDYKLVESSTTAMLAELDSAIKEEKPIVVTLWRPHIAYANYELKDLEDPEGSMGEGEEIHMVGRKGFGGEFEEVNGWLKKFKLTDEELSDLETLTINEHKDDPNKGAEQWLKDNPDYLQKVMGDDAEGLKF